MELVLGERSPLPNAAGREVAAFLPEARVTWSRTLGISRGTKRPGCARDALARVAATCA